MNPSIPLRIASAISLLMCAGHSAGGLRSWSPIGDTAVLRSMRTFQFPVGSFTRTYWDFYMGFGIVISVFLLAQAVMLWQLASWARTDAARVRPMIIVFFATTVAGTILDAMFFFTPPIVLSASIALCLGLALLPAPSAAAEASQPVRA